MVSLGPELPPIDWGAVDVGPFQSEGVYTARTDAVETIPLPSAKAVNDYQAFLDKLGYYEREVYLRRCLGLDVHATRDGLNLKDGLVTKALQGALDKWERIALRENLLLYPVNRLSDPPGGLDAVEIGYRKLVESRLPEDARSPDNLLVVMHDMHASRQLLQPWYDQAA